MSASVKSDVASRAARERAELACAQRDGTLALEACDLLADLFSAGYRLTALAEPSRVAAKPVRLRARYEGLCAACGAPIALDEPIWFTRGHEGVECGPCGDGGAR